jgi:hypothetical protein
MASANEREARRRDHPAAQPIAAPPRDQLTLLDRHGCATLGTFH